MVEPEFEPRKFISSTCSSAQATKLFSGKYYSPFSISGNKVHRSNVHNSEVENSWDLNSKLSIIKPTPFLLRNLKKSLHSKLYKDLLKNKAILDFGVFFVVVVFCCLFIFYIFTYLSKLITSLLLQIPHLDHWLMTYILINPYILINKIFLIQDISHL